MKLSVGERLEGVGPPHQPGGYVVTSVVRETPWNGLYLGKKIFYNFDFTSKRVRETDDVEWLDVFLRTIRYPVLNDPAYVQQRRALARAEARAILGNRHSNLWPEPLDLLEVENTRDPFTFADATTRTGEPVLVFTRPTGRFTPQWQQQIVPISSIFSVLAELLEFLKQAHAEGLLLLGLGPSSLLIDASDRVHYLGTEMVLSQQSIFLKETTAAPVWQRLFPADRFARGYSAPECFDPTRRPDVRADLYAWGSLAFGLVTGIELGKVAHDQGSPWTTFTEAHWKQFEKVLAQLPRNSLVGWAEQIGVAPEALLEAWPHKLVSVFRMLLSADPARRPGSVAELLAWIADPPPPPVAGFIALHTGPDEAKLLFDCTGIEMGLDVIVQCERSVAPRRPTDGTTAVQGPLRPVIGIGNLPLTEASLFYTAFTRRAVAPSRERGNEKYVYSPGVSAELWYADASQLRPWVEREAIAAPAHLAGTQQMPMRVGMVLGALDTQTVADSLIASPMAHVRAWGLRRVEQLVRQGWADWLQVLLWRFIADVNVEVRQSAATTLWTCHPTKSDDVLLRLVEALEAPPIDAPIPLTHFLRQLKIADERIQRVIHLLEAKRPTECPLCKTRLTLGERGPHLQSAHGYLLYEGDVVPAEAVFSRLWEHVFYHQDQTAHDKLLDMYLNFAGVAANQKPAPQSRETARSESQETAVERYIQGLQKILLGESKFGAAIPVALPYAAVMAYQQTLRSSKLFVPIVQHLLHASKDRLREMGCQTLLPHLRDVLRSDPTPTAMQLLLGVFFPEVDQAELQIDLCRQLGQLGFDQSLVNDCIALLQEERLVVCSECRAKVQAKNLELHLRRAHQIFQFRGERRGYQETRDAIVEALCAAPPDVAAWHSLNSLAEDKHPKEADRYLIVWLFQHFKDADTDERSSTVKNLTAVMIATESAARLVPICLTTTKNASWALLGQRFALEICARLPLPIAAELIQLVMPILDVKDLPRRGRENAVLALLRSVEKKSTVAVDVLRAYVAETGKKRAMEKLQQLEQRFGQHPAIDLLTKEFDDDVRMTCPRCTTELRKKEMVAHLWDKHRLVLDGERVREPWRVLEDWIVDYGMEKDVRVLQRCRELALRDDPQTGLARLQRLLYRRGLRDRELLTELRTQVRARNSSLCPHCCGLVPVADAVVVQPIVLDESSLEGCGYHVEVSERGIIPSLLIESPEAIVYRGREPGRSLTRIGGILVLCGPLIPATYAAIHTVTGRMFPEVLVWIVALGAGLFSAGLFYLIWPSPRPAKGRLIDSAWALLVPDMLEEKLGRREWGFLHGLLALSNHHEISRKRLRECCEQASEAAAGNPLALACLAALCRRYLADLHAAGEEPFAFVLALSADCFNGKAPVSFLNDLLTSFHDDTLEWEKSDLLRLTIALADQAFKTDVDVDDWLNLGRAFPVVSALFNLEQRGHWLQFHAVWSQRETRPWKKAGKALTMLELADAPDEYQELLAHYPDVLLYAPKTNLVVGSKGVWIEGVCVASFPRGTEVDVLRTSNGHELRVGSQRIRCSENPHGYLDEIRGWLQWYFHEFVPSIPSAIRPQDESRHRMWQLDRITCPECSRPLVPCLGDLGIALR